jgi:hypothetical protein
MRASRSIRLGSLLLGIGLALAGCARANSPSTAEPRTPSGHPDLAFAPAEKEPPRTTRRVVKGRWMPAKGIGASGGPSGREDLRPDRQQ